MSDYRLPTEYRAAYNPRGGEQIDDAAKRMVELVNLLGGQVIAWFNDTELIATAGTRSSEIVAAYWLARREGGEG